jgi:enamine deaminase RidA (YjgF/YER057c/UK114 family)
LISESFTDHQKPLPALSLIRCGALPLEGAQVVLEAIAAARKPVNPFGLAFIAAVPAVSDNPRDPVAPLMNKTLESLHKAAQAAGATSSDMVRLTCFMSSLDNLQSSRTLVEGEYPHAAVDYIQTQRNPARGLAACEAVARLTAVSSTPFRTTSAEGVAMESGESQIGMVGAEHVVLTGTQVSFGYEPKDGHLAFERLQKELEQAGTSARNVAFAHFYPLAYPIAAQIRLVRKDFFDAAHPPAASMLVFEGLTSMDAGFAVDVVAVK